MKLSYLFQVLAFSMITAVGDSIDDDRRLAQEQLATVVPHRPIPAWLLSCSFHALVLVALILLIRSTPRGADVEPARRGGIVLVRADLGQVEYLDDRELDRSQPATAGQNITALPDPVELPPELPGVSLQWPAGAERDADFAGAPSRPGDTSVSRPRRDWEATATTEVFGVKGTGSRFVYVFDRSASMDGYGGRPLRAAKNELIASLASLDSVHQFQIMFYNDQPQVFNPTSGAAPAMLFATEENKRGGERFVRSIEGTGGTDHVKALKMALSLGPDVVFLLTDAEGGLTAHDLGEIRRLNRSGAVINAIEFGVGRNTGRDRSLEELATQHRGQYAYQDIESIGN